MLPTTALMGVLLTLLLASGSVTSMSVGALDLLDVDVLLPLLLLLPAAARVPQSSAGCAHGATARTHATVPDTHHLQPLAE
jgi:hypothetical protein